MSVLRFLVPGVPVPCARARVVKGHAFTPVRTAAYEHLVALHARSAMAATRWQVGGEGPFAVTLDVYRAARRGDIDNLSKGILDGLSKAGAWRDDRYIEDLHVRMHVDKQHPRALVEVRSLSTNQGS